MLRGGSRIFFKRGCTRLLLYFNTNKPHSFFFFRRIPVVLENRRSSQRGGVRTPCTLPLDPPLMLITLRAERVNTGLFYRKCGRTCVFLIRVRLDTGFFFVIF